MTAFLDTNILIYAVGTEESEVEKRRIARGIIMAGNCALSMQTLQEFIWRSTRPHKGPKLDVETALRFVDEWRSFSVQETTLELLDEGLALLRRHQFNFWDAMIVAAARAQGCDILYTEDMQNGRIIDGLRIVNPFG